MYFMEFKVEIYEFLICYAVKAILDIYSIVIYVNLVIFFKNIYSCLCFFLNILEIVRVCLVWDLQTRHMKRIIFIWKEAEQYNQ